MFWTHRSVQLAMSGCTEERIEVVPLAGQKSERLQVSDPEASE